MLNACSASPHSARVQLTLLEQIQDLTVMPTLAAVEPPTPRNVHLYRAAVLVWRKAWREELCRHDGHIRGSVRAS